MYKAASASVLTPLRVCANASRKKGVAPHPVLFDDIETHAVYDKCEAISFLTACPYCSGSLRADAPYLHLPVTT